MTDQLDKFIDDHACRDPKCGCGGLDKPNYFTRLRWWVQRRRRAHLRPVYSNGQLPFPPCVHRWRTEDRRPPGRDDLNHPSAAARWYVNVICTRCRAVRCGDSTDPTPCVRHRHHPGSHSVS